MKVMECYCDGCGAKITDNPYVVMVYQKENETGSYITGTEYNPDKDFCGECKGKIVDFMEHFGIAEAESGTSYAPENENHARNEREEESIEVGTNQKEYGIFDEAEQTELNEERYKSMTIKEMILEGITDEEIMRIKECNRQSIYTARNKLKKEGKLTGAAVVKENETILPHDCKDVIKTCAYSSRLGAEYFCDYIGKAGKRRNCKPGACTAYRRG